MLVFGVNLEVSFYLLNFSGLFIYIQTSEMLILVFLMPSIVHVVIRDMGQTLQDDICYNQHEMIKVCFIELRKSI